VHRRFQNNSEKFSCRLKTFISAPGIFHHAQVRFRPHPARTETKTHKNSKSKTTNKDKKMKKRPEENAMKRMSILIFAAVFAWFGLYRAPNTFGVVPPPDGGYPNFTTAEGENALFNLTTDMNNATVGSSSLKSSTIGSFNTAIAVGTLLSSTGRSKHSH
jgi:hypothetical protein